MKLVSFLWAVSCLLAAGPAQGQVAGELLKQGQEIYEHNCADCHRTNGEGLPVKFPALKGSAYVMGDPQPLLDTVVNGRTSKLGQMPPWKEHLSDAQIAAAVTYIRNAWGNQAPAVTTTAVAAARK